MELKVTKSTRLDGKVEFDSNSKLQTCFSSETT